MRREGVANAELARKEDERSRKRKADEDDYVNRSRKRSRSSSSCTSDSVSTISTALSRLSSRDRIPDAHTGQSQLLSKLGVNRKRKQGGSSSVSVASNSSYDEDRELSSRNKTTDGRARRRFSERSIKRGRHIDGERRNFSRSRSLSGSSDTPFVKRQGKAPSIERGKRRRRSSRSPIDRGRERAVSGRRGSRRTRSSNESRDRGEVIRNRKSMTPGLPPPENNGNSGTRRFRAERGDNYSIDNDRYGSSARAQDTPNHGRQRTSTRPPRIERSLSPFSKRLALTQAMNMGN